MLPVCELHKASGHPLLVHSIKTRARGSSTGMAFSSAASTRVKIAVFAPMPMTSEATTAALTA